MPFKTPLGERAENQRAPIFLRPLQDRRVIVGQNVILDCQVDGHPAPAVKWLKDGHDVTLCPDYELTENGKRHCLVIKNVQGADNGRFTIQAMNAAGIKQSTCMLIVAPAPTPLPGAQSIANSPAPPQTPVGPSAPMFLKNLQHQPLKPGALVVFEARVVGQPVPQIEWFKNGKPLDVYRVKKEYDPQTGICALTIPQMFAEDEGEYNIRAKNNNGEATSSARLLPKDQFDRWFSEEQAQITRDRKQKLLASQQRGHPQPQPPPRSSIPQRMMSGVNSDSDTAWGVSESETEPELFSNGSFQRGAAPLLRSELRGLRLTEGTDAILQCNVVGNPKPQIVWLKNGVQLNPAGQPRIQMNYRGSMAVLKISMVSVDDSGEYVVIGENQYGRVHSSAKIEVYPLVDQSRQRQQPPPPQQQHPQYQQPARLAYEQPRFSPQQQQQQHQPHQYSEPQPRYQQPQQQYYQEPVVRHQQQQQQQQPYYQPQQQPRYPDQQAHYQHYQQQQQHPYQPQQHHPPQQQQPQQPLYHHQQQQQRPVYYEQVESGSPYFHQHQYRQQPREEDLFYQQQQQRSMPVKAQPPVPATKPLQQTNRPAVPPQFQQQPASTTVKGGEAAHFSARVVGQPAPSVTWHRSDGTPLVHDPRKYEIRTMPGGLHQLAIRDCSAKDADTYLCVAENAGGAIQSRCSLNVLQQRQSNEAPQFVGKFQSVSVHEGDTVRLYCKAVGDVTSMTWSRDGQKLATGGNIAIEDISPGETTITVKGAKMSDGGWYQCDAANAKGSSSLKGRVVVQAKKAFQEKEHFERIVLRKADRSRPQSMFLEKQQLQSQVSSKAPPSFDGQLKSQQANQGQNVIFECKIKPADDPNLKIAWLQNGKALLNSSRVNTTVENGVAILEINNVNINDEGQYTAVAVNQLGEARSTAELQVAGIGTHLMVGGAQQARRSPTPATHVDRPNFHSDLRSMELFEGQPIHLETKLTPINDPSLKIEWYFNGNPLKTSERMNIVHQSGFVVLQIQEATLADGGYYVCRAINQTGTAETNCTIVIHPKVDVVHTMHTHTTQNRHLDVDDVRDMQYHYSQTKDQEAPVFVKPISNFQCIEELGRSYFEARIAPVNDPSLRVIWLKDGHSLPNASRIQTFHNFGCVTLTLHPTYPEDAGTYTCVLHNVYGDAQCSATLQTMQTDSLQLGTQHEESLQQIGYLEGHQVHIGPMLRDRPEEFNSMEQPKIARPLTAKVEVNENDPVHFECRIQPASDVKMQVEWLHNGAPLPAAHRFRPMFDFGYVALDLLYAYPEDSGTYTMICKNELGQAESSLELVVNSQKTLYLDAQHPEGLERIQELEQPRERGLQEVPDLQCDNPPKFLGNLENKQLVEDDDLHFDLKLTPINDPTMTVEWFVNGQPLRTANRVKTQYDFGFISLDLRGVIAEDSGTYAVRAKNALGEDVREAQVEVQAHATVLSSTQHEESLGKIIELESLDKYGKKEVEDVGPQSGPQFVQPLPGDIGEVEEGLPLHLECKVEPTGDNSLKIVWLKDGQPIPHAHRFRTFHDFGFVSLDILHVYAEDSGTYSCVATNALGQAQTDTSFTCQAKSVIIGQTQHPTSVARIQELEAPKPLPEEAPEAAKEAPRFLKPLGTGQPLEANESDNVYLEAQISPVDDNTLTYEWYLNGAPLKAGHKFVLTHDFGFIALNILYMYPEDSGVYSLVIRNAAGEARSDIEIQCGGKEGLLSDTFHPTSISRITELEAPRPQAEEVPEAPKQTPQISRPLPPSLDAVHESQTLHLEAQVTPVDDNTLRVEWFHNGAPMKHSSRYRLMNDFGYVSLDIDYIIPEDAGEYTLVVSNEAGQAQTTTKFDVDRLKTILDDTSHPESLRRIQEIEAVKPALPSEPDLPPEAPVFTQQLNGPTDPLKEGQSVHMDCMVQPINDPNLKIEWYHNGQPIAFASRMRSIHDFGYVALEFLHIHAEDSGTYTCRAVNTAGEARTDFTIECRAKRNLYLDTQHEESWQKIQEMENREPIREPSPELSFPPPTFTEPLQNEDNLIEGEGVRLECRLIPVNDPTLKVFWTKNGQPLPEGSRFMPARNFDIVNLDLMAVYAEDSGVYNCKAVSAFGEAQTSCTVKCAPTDILLLDTQHQESWDQIQEIESRKPPEPIITEPEKIPPKFVVPLPSGLGEFQEGVPVHLECQVEPTNDNQLVVEWFRDGAPLSNGHRFRTTHDFGYVALDILYLFPQDAGTYTCVARNELGEAQTQASFNVISHGTIFGDVQHPNSWQKIQEIEAPKAAPEEPAPVEYGPPKVEAVESLERIEGQPAHFETRVTPANDPRLQIQWFKDGQPLQNSNRFAHTHDFGFVALDIAYLLPNDTGVYTVVARNDHGEDMAQANLNVGDNPNIIIDTQHESSWQKIQIIEAPKAAPEAEPDLVHGPPKFTQQLNSVTDLVEGQPAHFEAMYQPINDPNLKVQWFHNGRPLGMSNRMGMRNDFGLATLDIKYVLGQDIGDYRCVVSNEQGEDQTEGHLDCQRRPNILSDVQHPNSWQRIQETEAPKEAPEAPAPITYAKPTFTQPLQSLGDLQEGAIAFFEGRVVPVGDPNLQIQWFLNDTPLKQSNRFAFTNDFGHVTLRIQPVYSHDSGVYSCKAINLEGAAISNASLNVIGGEVLLLDTAHPISLQKIQDLEALDKFPRLEAPEMEFQKPTWTQTFENVEVGDEGGVVQLNGFVEPVADPNLRIEWFLNGTPLQNANRFRSENNFGHVTLTIVHVFPQDSGVYSCRAYNLNGEATTSATVKVAGYEALLLGTQHPVSWERIQELERPKIVEEIEMVEEKEKPRFLTQLESVADAPEGSHVHLEATFQPARDPDLQVFWLKNGQPLGASQLVRTHHELGWACLDIHGVNLDHNGVYTLTLKNSEGEAASSASIKVAGIGDILGETSHEESWRRIQEIEAPKEPAPEPPPPEYDTPSIQTQINDIECEEGEPSLFEATYQPTNDPNLKVQWIRNGEPLAHGSKYAISHDFGYCTLAIGYTFPEDQGVYQVRVWNDKGEAVSSATLKCQGKDVIMGDVQHEESWRRIQEIEAPKAPAPEMPPAPKVPPKFTSPISSVGEVVEGQPAHFEATVEPIDDPELKIQWYLNGAPVTASSRVKMINDFGWVIMDINATEPRDSGEWTCVASNSAGEASASTQINVQGKESLLLDPLHPQSLERILEIEAGKPAPEEAPAVVFEAPKITVQLAAVPGLAEGDSAHLEAQFTPVADPNLKVEWYKDGALLHHANRYKMVSDFGFAILDILYLLAHDAGEFKLRVFNEAGEASTTVSLEIESKSGLLLDPQDENKARAVQEVEDARNRRPEEVEIAPQERMPVFVEPLSAPVQCESGDRAHFSARYEPLDDNQLRIQWFLNGNPLKLGSRVKTINDFGYVVLEISPVYPEDSGEYVCKAINNVGEAVTSTKLECTPKENIITQSQLPERMSGAQAKITEIESRRPQVEERPDVEHGAPKFVTQLPQLPTLTEGQAIHLDVQVEPVADPRLKIEWFHNGNPIRNSNRMKTIHDFGFVVLELMPAEPQDTGTWTCRATNDHGSAEISCEIEVTGDSGVSYEWASPGERKEQIQQLEQWINRPREQLDQPAREYGAPTFTQQLTDLGTLSEADATSFICILEPVGDPTMRVEWTHNGHAIPYSNRIYMSNDFGVISLLIKHLITQDAGEYRCIARNAKGEAQTVGQIVVESIVQIDAPEIVQALVDNIDNVHEGDSIHMECRVLPINDPKLQVQWLRNGAPLPEASRFKTNFEFGFVTLDILYAYPEDNGEYELIAFNDKGQASTKSHITVLPKSALIFAPQAPGSRVDSIESHLRQYTRAPVALSEADAYDEKAGQPPVFKSNLLNIGVEEGDFCRFETQVAPIGDPYLKVEWFRDGRPVLIGNRIRSTLDFGFASLDLLYALPDDTGEYTCVATNRHGQQAISAKLACSGSQGIITESQMPQGVLVADVKKNQDQLHWQETMVEQSRVKQAPQFTIRPRNIQAVEGEPARFECAVIGNPKPKVTWLINGTQAIHGHRHKLNYDGIHYLTITHSKISDAGEIVAIAKNSEGEVLASANLDVFQKKDFRHVKLKPAQFMSSDELQERQAQWQRETMGTLGEAFEQATKADVQKLVRVERSKSPIEPLETEELVQKFTRPRDDQFYDRLAYVEHVRPQFEGLKLEEVPLKPGRIEKYQPPVESMESVQLKARGAKEALKAAEEKPQWASGERALGDVESRFKRLPEPEKEVVVPHRDTIRLKTAKPTRAAELPPMDHVQIETEKAKVAPVKQGPEVPKEVNIPAKDQVQIKQKFQPVAKKPSEPVKIESGPMKQTPPVVKEKLAETTISNKSTLLYQSYRERQQSMSCMSVTREEYHEHLEVETEHSGVQRLEYSPRSPRTRERTIGFSMTRPQPTKIGQSQKAPPVFSQQLKPAQAQIGRSARFFCAFDGAQPINVKWFHNGKELKSAFDTQIRTTNTGSTLDLTKLKDIHQGEYLCSIENVAGKCESSASLEVQAAVDRGVAPDFKTRMSDARAQQNASTTFNCVVGGSPKPVITWFKDGKQLPNDGRYKMLESGDQYSLQLDDVLPPDGGIYECVAKNAAGEARCKARLNIVLAKTGQGQEAGPRIEAPRFVAQIQPVVADEGKAAEFRAKYTGSPDPAIRWYRNNEPIKPGRNYDFGQANGEAWLKILQCSQEDVAEYKCDAVNPGGKATTVANLVLKPKGGKIMMTTRASGSTAGTTQVAANGAPKTGGSKAPQFLSKLSSINARAGENVKLVAEIDGDPQPTVAWQFNGKPIYGGRDQKISLVGNKAMLEIARVQQANAGTYIITIRNPSGAAQCEAKINLQSR
ncbi:hypothetical protein QR680_003855 [Steinernema hermaphroditum]|uniref:Ig-like domain-containing protein n=1 Tax=Steinernema hermaphroditum TaxID=289476 RepID=A0AA39HP24_9BILA|nr:hypothetical protein QR680_003855 [Steinernema hermaphroditum]